MDKRKEWTYRECRIEPVKGPVKYFGSANFRPDSRCVQYRTLWWKVHFPDGTWCDCGTKEDCRRYVSKKVSY